MFDEQQVVQQHLAAPLNSSIYLIGVSIPDNMAKLKRNVVENESEQTVNERGFYVKDSHPGCFN